MSEKIDVELDCNLTMLSMFLDRAFLTALAVSDYFEASDEVREKAVERISLEYANIRTELDIIEDYILQGRELVAKMQNTQTTDIRG